jgi:hypothetical protein
LKITQPLTAGKRITLVFGKMNVCFHEESSILAEKTQFAGIANSLTGDTLLASAVAMQRLYDAIGVAFSFLFLFYSCFLKFCAIGIHNLVDLDCAVFSRAFCRDDFTKKETKKKMPFCASK